MNKILVIDDKIEIKKLDDSIKCDLIPKNNLFEVNTLSLTILKSTDLTIEYKVLNDSKLNIKISCCPDVCFNINEFREGAKAKIKYNYIIDSNSTLNVYKFYDIDILKEFVKIDLNGEGASVNYNFKTISKNSEKYDITIYHNKRNTSSNIINNGVNILDGSLVFNVSSFVFLNNIKCNVYQNSRIINLTNSKCQICPNLYIDEYDVTASHSAHIGTFKDDELFYITSRGIDEREANYLLIKGFLLNNMNNLSNNILDTLEKYWR